MLAAHLGLERTRKQAQKRPLTWFKNYLRFVKYIIYFYATNVIYFINIFKPVFCSFFPFSFLL